MCFNSRHFSIVAALLLLLAQAASAQTWIGGGANTNWTTTANWFPAVVPANNGTAALSFTGNGPGASTVDVAYSINSLTFANSAGVALYTIGGTTLTIGSGGFTSNDADTQTINNNITLSAAQTWNATSGPLVINGPIATAGNALTFNVTAGSSTLGGTISGAGALTKNGAGTLKLSGAAANIFSGTTTVNAGTLLLAKIAGFSAIPGNLVIGDDVGGASADVVRHLADKGI